MRPVGSHHRGPLWAAEVAAARHSARRVALRLLSASSWQRVSTAAICEPAHSGARLRATRCPQVLLWTFCLINSCSAAESSGEDTGYLLRETVRGPAGFWCRPAPLDRRSDRPTASRSRSAGFCATAGGACQPHRIDRLVGRESASALRELCSWRAWSVQTGTSLPGAAGSVWLLHRLGDCGSCSHGGCGSGNAAGCRPTPEALEQISLTRSKLQALQRLLVKQEKAGGLLFLQAITIVGQEA